MDEAVRFPASPLVYRKILEHKCHPLGLVANTLPLGPKIGSSPAIGPNRTILDT